MLALLGVRLGKLMLADSGYYAKLAEDLHERERPIKAARGRILDRNGEVLADNNMVCTISVIHSQITDSERVVEVLTKELGLDKETVQKKSGRSARWNGFRRMWKRRWEIGSAAMGLQV